MNAPLQTLEEVRAAILARLEPLTPESVTLDRAAGRTLAADVAAHDAIPPFDNTAMDGFALRAADTDGASPSTAVTLRVTGAVEAGADELPAVEAGTAVRIYTGAPIPPGADAIVPWEKTARFDDTTVTLEQPVKRGACIRRQGEDLDVGAVALPRGLKLNPAAVGLLASVGCPQAVVGKRVRVAVHSSGNELVPIESALTPGKIRNSNLSSIAARLERWGAHVLPRPVLRDTPTAVRDGLRRTLSLAPDVIITTGGVSAGDLDFIREVAREDGEDVVVRKVNMKPGKPLVDGAVGGVPFFGLPGNPVACLVSFEMFVRPALAKLEGRPDGLPPQRRARLSHDFDRPKVARRQFLRGIVEYSEAPYSEAQHSEANSEYVVAVPDRQGSHQLSSFAHANCLVELTAEGEGAATPQRGDEVRVHLLD